MLKRDNRFLILLVSLVLFFAAYPIAEGTYWASKILSFFFILIVLAGVYAIAETKGPFLISFTLAVLVIISRWSSEFFQSSQLSLDGVWLRRDLLVLYSL